MLRTALETLGHGYVILDVPSAEEAQLEMRRGEIDLLVTDLRLPGISGLELIHKLRRASITAAMIVISAYADETTQAEIRAVGATFFAKPLSLAEFLRAVQLALGSRPAGGALEPEAPADGATGIATRLARLRRDLGALAVGLVDGQAQLSVSDGDFSVLALDAVLAPLLTTFGAARQISAALGGPGPNSLTFVDGQAYDMYAAGVGLRHTLLIFFEGERGATQMGPVLRYGRQCADEILRLLPSEASGPAPAAGPGAIAVTAPLSAAATTPARPTPPAVTAPLANPAPRPPAPALTAAELQHLDDTAKQVTSADAANFWKAADGDDIGDIRSDTLSFEQATQLGLMKTNKPPS